MSMSLRYQKECLTAPIVSSIVFGGVFSGIDAAAGRYVTPRHVGTYMAGIYIYNAMQCPMEAIHGRQSLWHNVISGGILGSLGVSSGRIGIPFISHSVFYNYPSLSPPIVAFAVYGGITGALASLSGKQF